MKKIIFVIAIISLLLSLGADEISGFYESTNDYAPVAYDSPLSTLKTRRQTLSGIIPDLLT